MKESEKLTKSIYNMDNEAPRGNWLSEFMWICSGADRRILRHCPPDHSKYVGIGGTILFTALMACLSGGYAFYTIFDDQVTAIVFGIFWGLLIFNLDRFMVNTMYSDGLASISKEEIMSGAPRIVMAIFLGIVISTPLELKIYHNEIVIEIEKMKQDKAKEYANDAKTSIDANKDEIDRLNSERQEILNRPIALENAEIISSNQHINELRSKQSDLSAELNQKSNKKKEFDKLDQEITSLNQRIAKTYNTQERKVLEKELGEKNALKERTAKERQQIESDIKSIRKELSKVTGDLINIDEETKALAAKDNERKYERISTIDKQIATLTAQNDSLYKHAMEEEHRYKDKLEKEFGGFQAQLSAFGHLKNENTTTQVASWFIMLLFIIIETVPTFFKMMMTDGPYDDLMRAERHIAKVMADKRINDTNDEINTQIDISMSRNLKTAETEQKVNEMAVERIAQAQAYVIQEAIDLWKLNELKKVRENPGKYLQTSELNEEDEPAKG